MRRTIGNNDFKTEIRIIIKGDITKTFINNPSPLNKSFTFCVYTVSQEETNEQNLIWPDKVTSSTGKFLMETE